MKKIRVVLVEDHPMFRERLAQLINKEPDMQVQGEADNTRDGFNLIANVGATVAVIDIRLKASSGLELIKNLRSFGVKIPLLVLSMYDEAVYAERALRAGAQGYITKQEASSKIMTAVRQVLAGQLYVGKQVTTKLISHVIGRRQAQVSGVERLSDRELAVFELLGLGRTARQIREELGLQAATVETYRARIKEKLNLENAAVLRSEAVRWVHRA